MEKAAVDGMSSISNLLKRISRKSFGGKDDKPAKAKGAEQEEQSTPPPAISENKRIYIVFYSMYGHIHKMALAQKEGVDSVNGCQGVLYQVPETLGVDVLEKMGAAPKPEIPVLDVHALPEADGIIFGFPTRYGMMAAQMKAFFDATGGLWKEGKLVTKPAAIFTSTGTQCGGQETTIFSAITQLAHLGMIFVPVGYSQGEAMFGLNEVRGGSPWGAGTYAGTDGKRQPSELELSQAKHQGKHFAQIVLKMN